jgi:LuxR family maltose regulon positive regulatory protein
MATPILTTKLHIPSPPQALVPRERLISRLDAGVEGRFILVSAPAGFGKTSLLAEWAQRQRQDGLVSWVHLDEHDNEPARFLSYLIAALQVHHENLGEGALAGLGSIPPPPQEAVLTSLVNEIAAQDDKLILILDDYHLIEHPSIHKAVGFLLDHLPPQICLVIATRADPPLRIHRLRARGQMIEIRAADLRFSSAETRRFLEKIINVRFPDEDITALDGRIEGWIAGLQMLALSIQDRKDAHEFIESFTGSHRFVVDFLTEEIFNQQPPHIQRFLLRTSLLERLSGPLCDAVLDMEIDAAGREKIDQPSQQLLEQLEHANLFLLPLDEERQWYRYHRLFAGVLQQRLRQTDSEIIPELLGRASAWHAGKGTSEEAYQYALAGGDFQAAAQLVEEHALDKLKRGSISTLLDQLNRLPEELVLQNPWLSVYQSWGLLLTGNFENLERFLKVAEAAVDKTQKTDDIRGHITAIRAYAAGIRGEVEEAIILATEALDLLPHSNLTVRSVVTFVLGGINLVRGDIPGAILAMKEAGRTGERAGNIHLAVAALNAAGDLMLSQRNSAEAEEIYGRALKLGTGRSGRPLPIAAGVYSGLAEIYLGRNDLIKARHFAEVGVDLANQWGNPENLVSCYLTLAQVSYREGETAQAQVALSEAKRLAATHTLSPGTEDRILAYETLIRKGSSKHLDQVFLVEPLTERELEVLGLLAEGRSNPEIATELIVALGTVKAHTSTIYRKLDVRGRTEAVIKARELGLLRGV